ncbi:MAG: PolC-type DNA polymerase III, partial [Erysipelotrichales bacterium]|nr:PolC-type DNA polymerase III [Erysipelotrichales bacterium]
HRADYDADVLAKVFFLMICDLRRDNVETLVDMQNYQDEEAFKKVRHKHVTLLVKNQAGLKDLFKLVSLSNIEYLATFGKSSGGEEVAAEPRIPRSEIQRLRENILVGSSCQKGEIFEMALNKTEEELKEAIKFYDYIEIQPEACYSNLIDSHSVHSKERLRTVIINLIKAAKEMGKMVVASGDVHYIDPTDKIFRDVYINSQGIGGARHPLYYFNAQMRAKTQAPDQHFRTTKEMFEQFSYLEEDLQKELIIDTPNQIFDMIEVAKPLHSQLYKPHLEGDEEKLKSITYENAYKQYGNPLPKLIEDRLDMELKSIIGNGFTVIYYVAHLLVKKSNDEGYIVGSRGSVGSSFVATMMKITEVNPLPPHYYCPKCQHVEWFLDGSVKSGYDLPDKACPHCGTNLKGDGQDIEFATFLGFYGDKVPDIDLNFSGEYQERAHAYTKELFGEKNVLRAGTIGGVAEKTAYGYVSGYFENKGIENVSSAEKLRLAKGCQDVKRTTGQHPGGIIVIPQYMDVYDFTPMQLPANNPDSVWRTSHFDFHAIHDNVLKLDILGHVDPTVLKMLERISGIDPRTIPMNDEKVYSLFNSTEALCLDSTQYPEKTGAIGLPEFGTKFVRGMLEDTLPSSFAELVQISGLSHGTDVWLNNAKDLIDTGNYKLMDVIGCRDDIMNTLIQQYDMQKKMAFDIMESVRKGRGLKPEMLEAMKECNVPQYYIDSCLKIKYLFPKGHAVAYVLSALRIAWFKVHHPHYYYAAYFTTRCDAYDIEVMSSGLESVCQRLNDIKYRQSHQELKKSVTNKENALITTFEVTEEMYLRGYSMSMIDLDLSLATEFRVHPTNNKIIIPPFTSLDGLGESVAKTIIEAREEMPFISQEDLMKRTSLSQTHTKKLEELGVLKHLQKENQLSLF